MPASGTPVTRTSMRMKSMSVREGTLPVTTASGTRVAVLVISGLLACGLGARAEPPLSTLPSAGFMAAALESQELAGAGNLELSCEMRFAESGKLIYRYRYVRTPDVLRLDVQSDAGKTVASYDRVTGAYRELTVSASGDERRGRTGYGRHGFLMRQAIPDIPLLPIAGTVLPVAVRQGQVADAAEVIDGHQCGRVELMPSERDPAIERHVVWVDRTIGFCPRRVRMTRRGGGSLNTYFEDYSEIADGVWLPTRVRFAIRAPEPPPGSEQTGPVEWENHVEVFEAVVGGEYSAEDLRVSFPHGGILRRHTPWGLCEYEFPAE